jgi:replication factor C subunit 2/4
VEHVQLDEGAMQTIMTVSEGDMRKAVTYLQSAHELAGKKNSISSDIVLDVAGQVLSHFFLISLSQIHPELLSSLWNILSSRSTSFDSMRSCVTDIILEGYPLTDILAKLHDDIITRDDFTDLDKALICDKIAQVTNPPLPPLPHALLLKADQCLIHGASELFQLTDVCSFILRRFRGTKNANDKISSSAADSL